MTLWWIGDIVLLVVVVPIVLYLLNGVLSASKSIVPSVRQIASRICGIASERRADSASTRAVAYSAAR